MIEDINAGVLKTSEYRPAAQRIYDEGRQSRHKGISEQSTALLRGITQDTGEGAPAMRAMAIECGFVSQ